MSFETFDLIQELRIMLRLITTIILLPTSACLADDLGTARAFATFDRAELADYLLLKPESEIAQYVSERGQNAVHSAILNNSNLDAIKQAFKHGADLNHQDIDGRTPLHHAIDGNLAAAALILIDLGARRDIHNASGFTAISFCKYALTIEPQHATCKLVNSP